LAIKLGDYKTGVLNDWCQGCGDFGIVNAIQMSLTEMQIPKHKAAIFSGIGCSGKTSHFINTYGVHTLHGRVLTFAQGAKIANPEMTYLLLVEMEMVLELELDILVLRGDEMSI